MCDKEIFSDSTTMRLFSGGADVTGRHLLVRRPNQLLTLLQSRRLWEQTELQSLIPGHGGVTRALDPQKRSPQHRSDGRSPTGPKNVGNKLVISMFVT